MAAVSAGAFFFLAGSVGLLRFPDALSRLHALTKADNLGLGLVMLGVLPRAGGLLAALKLVFVWLLVHLCQRDGVAAHCSRRAAGRFSAVTVASALAVVLSLVLLAIAAWTIAARQTFAAVVGFVAYGLLLSIAWVALSAIDVALTEAAIGGGLTGVLLIGAAARLRATEAAVSAERPGAALRWLAALISAAGPGAIAVAVLSLPDPAHSGAGGRRTSQRHRRRQSR